MGDPVVEWLATPEGDRWLRAHHRPVTQHYMIEITTDGGGQWISDARNIQSYKSIGGIWADLEWTPDLPPENV